MPDNVSKLLIELMKFGNIAEQKSDIECVKFATQKLEEIGCASDLQIFEDTANSLSTIGEGEKHLCFCGHCDVVPFGNNWSKNPRGEIVGEKIFGRGAVDMLGGDACWISAVSEIAMEKPEILKEVKISTLLTGAEEGEAKNGTNKFVDYLLNKNINFNACIVGEPTNKQISNDLNYICCGRQGSLHFEIDVFGKSGHIAYKNNFDNPIKKATFLCNELYKIYWNEYTNLEISGIEAHNNTSNVVLDRVKIFGNVRFYETTKDEVEDKILKSCDILKKDDYKISFDCQRYGFKSEGKFLELVKNSVEKYSKDVKAGMCFACTDGEYMTRISDEVCEFGLCEDTMHKPDEFTTINELDKLKNIYKQIIIDFVNFSKSKI